MSATAARWRRRRRTQLGLLAAIFLLLVGSGTVALWRVRENNRQRRVDETRERDEDQRLAAKRVEGQRLAANGEKTAELLDRFEVALRAEDIGAAGLLFEQAEKRAADGGADGLSDRFARGRVDFRMLRALDEVDGFQMTLTETELPSGTRVAERWRAAFAGYGIVVAEGSVGMADRVRGSLLRASLVSALDLWLFRNPEPDVRALLRATDPDPYRDAVRDAVVARDLKSLVQLVGQPDVLTQPAGFTAALGRHGGFAAAERRRVLEAALRARPGNLGLLLALGDADSDDPDGRLRWYRAAVASHPRSVLAHLRLGNALLTRKEYKPAVAAYNEAIRLNPTTAQTHRNLGVALQRMGDFGAAVVALREAVRLDPKDPLAHNNLGVALRDKGDLDAAVAALREAGRLDPKDLRSRRILMDTLITRGGVGAAVAYFRDLIRADPDDTMSLYYLGVALRRQSALEAVDVFRQVVESQPDFPPAHLQLGALLHEAKDFRGAATAYEKAFRDPQMVAADPQLAEKLETCQLAIGDVEGAVRTAREVVRRNPSKAIAHHKLADILQFHARDHAGAVVEYREAIKINPNYAWSHNNLGGALLALGKHDEAIVEFREVNRLEPTRGSAYVHLSRLLRGKKDFDGVLAALKETVRLNPNSADLRDALGEVYRENKDLDAAIAAYREAIRLDSKQFNAHAHLGQALFDKKDYVGAAAAAEQAIDLNPKEPNVRYQLGQALRAQKKPDAAVDAYRAGLKLDPKRGYIYHALGDTLQDKSDFVGAISAYREALRLNPNDSSATARLSNALWAAGKPMLAPPPREVKRP